MPVGDLATLFERLGPTGASMVAGQREAEENQKQQLANLFQQAQTEELKQKIGQSTLMNPLLLDAKKAEIANEQAKTPGIIASGRKAGTEADILDATKGGAIAATNSKHSLDVLADQTKQLDNFRNQLTSYAALLGNGPDAEARKQQLLASGQIPQGHLYNVLASHSAAELPALMEKMNKYVNEQTAAYQNELLKTRSQEKIAAGHDAAARYAADKSFEGKMAVASAGANKLLQNYQKASPSIRIGISKTALDTGINPFTHDPLTPQERQAFQSAYDQDAETINASNAARQQPGVAPTVGTNGNLELTNKVPPKVGGAAKRGTAENPIKLD